MTQSLPKVSPIRQRVSDLLAALCAGLYEREEPVRLALLSAVAGESIFLLGPPGVGKSLIARRLKHAFLDGISFEYLMSKFSTPEEVFGPISIKKLKEEDKYERLTDRYLPGANIVFLDEIWKAGPAIQNALLTILNEKIYRNGEEDVKVDIQCIITASNELPPASANLAPIWDRFLLRLEMGDIQQLKNFLDMITAVQDVYADDIDPALKISQQTLGEWAQQIDRVTLGPEVLNTVQLVKVKLAEYNARPGNASVPIVVHDRRWKKIIRVLRTSAFLNGRSRVDLMDCFLMYHCLWSRPEQQTIIRDILTEAVAKHGYTMAVKLGALKREVQAFQEDVEREIRVSHTVSEEQLMVIDDEYFQLEREDSRFQGDLVTIKQYRQLSIEEEAIVNFYDSQKNLVSRIRATRGKQPHTLVVYHDAQQNIYKLTTKLVDRVQTISKQPHPVVQQYWDEQYQRLATFIDQQLANMRDNEPEALHHLTHNLFVAAEFAAVVRQNHTTVVDSLTHLKLQLEQLQFAYLHI